LINLRVDFESGTALKTALSFESLHRKNDGRNGDEKTKSWRYLVFPYVGAFPFVRDADKPSNVKDQENHSQFFSIHSI
jgi:hypothetical protein